MIVDLANAGLFAAIFTLCGFPALFRKRSRGWLLLGLFVVLADCAATSGGFALQNALPGMAHHWNWFGKLASLIADCTIALIFSLSGRFRLREMGASFLQSRGTLWAVLFVAVPVVLVQSSLTATFFGDTTMPSREAVLFQALMPGPCEELFYRGLVLALLDRAFVGRITWGGAKLGYGAFVVTAFFGLAHGVVVGDDLQLHTSWLSGVYAALVAIPLVWLRVKTGSIAVPALTHNALNVVSNVVPRLL